MPLTRYGLDIDYAIQHYPSAKFAYVTPSHQYPLGGTLPLGERLKLLQWAAKHQVWIVEDDYDSEFRYNGRPVPALKGLDDKGRVIYTGTFSKVLFPALRLGYMVLPRCGNGPAVQIGEVYYRPAEPCDRPRPLLHSSCRKSHFCPAFKKNAYPV